ncbi:histidine kinase [Paenibacillus alginolyticus]|uniref:Histidine kinase n=1 Tax=Paenibacillus alginolyticus TaxID=59839 RepID=A0ABT4GN10_9BACL|nr:sensor histidine kinase [Paenibacillus alginolyticus]MCY9663447.1 histidine kinase [Paenibacillus alginolyticus]MCY9697404.1 histidine kinase [Paenibacillus alginolyticus]MEC0146253.1 histidine kinase [Paenibacillus alginolyticus]
MFNYMVKSVKRSLKWKLISIIVTILIFTVSTIGISSYIQTKSSVRKDIDHLSMQVLKQANMNLNRYYSEYELAFLMLSNSLEVRDWMRVSSPTVSSELIRNYERIKDNYLNRLFLQYPEILSATLYNPSGYEQHFVNTYALPLNYSIKNEPYFSQSGNFEKIKFITGISENYMDAANQKIKIPVLTLFKQSNNGYLKIDISLTPSQKVMDQINIANSGVAVVMDQSGTVIHHSHAQEVMGHMDDHIVQAVKDQQEGSVFDKTGKELIIFQTIQMTGWKIVAILPYQEIAKSINYTRNMTIIIAISALIISVLLTYFAASSITGRILGLRKMMKAMQLTSSFHLRAEVEGIDEVADLSISFNNLLGHLEQSIHDHAETRVLQHRAVISALQSQINSHFLYNTLETINSMAVISKQSHIGHVAVNLSNMLRYTSDFKNMQVILKEEIKHLENYLTIMKVRFKDEVTYSIEVPEELLHAVCTKALLQPLVENSIKHGRETTGESVHIRVSGEVVEGDKLLLTVTDNGPGFTAETLVRLTQEQADSHAHQYRHNQVGLSNLIYRLHMFYSGEAKITFFNDPVSGGAVVEVFLPLQDSLDK